uniref:DNA-directed DNA polymerase n=1 Tax=Tanacetum cinerariifolium TaxID=118510 RepID=A0A6L2LF47_TANCI|nr:DNA-directed DNA polymerase [Tanacetum cinerariifolium]
MATNGNGDDVPPVGGAIVGQTQNVYATRAYNQGGNSYQPQGTLPSNTITNPKEDLKGITTQSGIAYKGPTIPTTSSPPKVVERETEVTKDTKLFDLARAPLNDHCWAALLKKLPEKLGDPVKFLILCDFSRMDECLALVDLGTSINLMPLFVCNKLSLPELSPACMTLELTDRSISRPAGVVEDVFVKVGKFYFLADFVVVDFDVDPRVPLILGRSFLKTGRALIDVYEGELTLRAGNKAVTFNIDQTSRYSANYDADSINRIDVIDVACEDNFLLEETNAFLAIKDEPISLETDYSYYDSKGDILLLKEFLNDDPSSPPLPLKELKVVEPKNEKYSIDELPVELKDEEKTALIKVLKSPKQALAWQLSDTKGSFTVVENKENELIPTQLVTRWRVCIDYKNLNDASRKDHFRLPFMDQMLERLAGNEYYCFLDGFLGYFQIPIDTQDQEKTTFKCPYGMFAYRRMPFGLCNAPGTFQRCMMAIFQDMIEKRMKVFMDDFSVFGNSFGTCLSHLDKMLKWCEDTNLCLN